MMLYSFVLCVSFFGDAPANEPGKSARADSPSAQKAETPPLRLEKRGKDRPMPRTATSDKKTSKQEQPVDKPSPTDRPAQDLDRDLLEKLEHGRAPDQDDNPLLRIGAKMRSIEDRLFRIEPPDATIDLQKQVLADLDELLKKSQRGGRSSSSKQEKQARQPNPAEQPQAGQKQGQQGNPNSNKPAQAAGRGQAQGERLAKGDEQKDVWGHLSAMLRQEMSQYAKDQFLEKYRDLLEQYYATIAAKSRRSNTE